MTQPSRSKCLPLFQKRRYWISRYGVYEGSGPESRTSLISSRMFMAVYRACSTTDFHMAFSDPIMQMFPLVLFIRLRNSSITYYYRTNARLVLNILI